MAVDVDAVEPEAKVGVKAIKKLAKDPGPLDGAVTGGSACNGEGTYANGTIWT